MRRTAIVTALVAVAAATAGCGGSGGEERPTGNAAEGKRLFTEQDCTSCHTLTAAANESNYGPNLDRLKTFASRADEPLADFIRTSIVDPAAYTEKGFPADAMPRFYGERLSDQQVESLVRFLVESATG